MEFTVVKNIAEIEFKKVIDYMVVGNEFKYEYVSGEIEQAYNCYPLPLLISITQKNGYLKVVTGLSDGWPFMNRVISKNSMTAMSIRYEKNSIAEFRYWNNGKLERLQHALKDGKWVWFGKGDIQPWEDISNYNERLIKNRLTASMLERYLNSFGCVEVVT